jgi:hypothetical protein
MHLLMCLSPYQNFVRGPLAYILEDQKGTAVVIQR